MKNSNKKDIEMLKKAELPI